MTAIDGGCAAIARGRRVRNLDTSQPPEGDLASGAGAKSRQSQEVPRLAGGWYSALLLALRGVDHFLDDLGDGDVAVIRLGVDEIERVPPSPNIELMIPARWLALAAHPLCSGMIAAGAAF
jgi:hypothetical protein